jgi:hypothetical protein
MRTTLLLTAAVAVALAAVGSTAALAADRQLTRYTFAGRLLAAPTATALSISVEGGSRSALRKMLGQTVNQTFSYGSSTEFLRWSRGIPTVVSAGNLTAGDWVAVHVRAPRAASLAEIETKAAGVVGDRGPNPDRPDKPLYLFRGTLTAVGSQTVAVDVGGGDRRALRLLVGQASRQSFAYDGGTIFLVWRGKVPTVISAGQLKVGDRIAVRIRARKGSTLAQVESIPANHIAEREPAGKP